MTEHFVPAAYSQKWPVGDRVPPELMGDERTLLVQYLDWHRATFELKCAGLADEQLSQRPVEPSRLSLHGLLRHLSGVERWWFRQQFAAEDLPMLYYTDDDPDQDFETLTGDLTEAFVAWRAECAAARAIVATSSLEDTATTRTSGETFSLRWLMLRMTAEYARHNGQADLLRERLDGATGE